MTRVGDILYRLTWDMGFGPWHRLWDEDCTEEDDAFKAEVQMETWIVRQVRRRALPEAMRARGFSSLGTPQHVYLRRYDPGHGMKFKMDRATREQVPVFEPFCPECWKTSWKIGEKPKGFRPSKKGAAIAAMAQLKLSTEFQHHPGHGRALLKRMERYKK
ncbi:gp37 [Alphaproteobacteria phage PhiJL001]|uniref:Gp37 n=1 Tax=Alphaproteobacteria phage PhiJL001 TaxID=2681607 RepID=Q5DN68_9CAUD|nr:gp37 [Alphaproteobacteria phage PhiJL001]AAT69513.1 gp37 [Alphaproteobacteria phage PhiJL001]